MTLSLIVDDTSPILNYEPYGDGIGLHNGWSTWYSTTGYVDPTDSGNIGNGTSFHVTSCPGAQMLLTFVGSSVTLYGAAIGIFGVNLDGQVYNGTSGNLFDDVLFAMDNLDSREHVVALLSVNSTQQLSFDYAVINSDEDSTGFWGNYTISAENTTAISYSKGWTQGNTDNSNNGALEVSYLQTTVAGASASFTFMGEAVELHGGLNFDHGLYDVTLDNVTTTLNGSSFFQVPDTIIFYESKLTAFQMHTLNVTNIDGALSLSAVVVYTDASPTPSSVGTHCKYITVNIPDELVHSNESRDLSIGVIVGLILGGIGAIGVAAVLFIVCSNRKKTRSDALAQRAPDIEGKNFDKKIAVEENIKKTTIANMIPQIAHHNSIARDSRKTPTLLLKPALTVAHDRADGPRNPETINKDTGPASYMAAPPLRWSTESRSHPPPGNTNMEHIMHLISSGMEVPLGDIWDAVESELSRPVQSQ